jgi:S1-C subfamily serine protease
MNWVDVLVLALALFAGISGARQGMVTALASFVGVLIGAVIGVRVAPSLVDQFQSPAIRVAFSVTVVILLVALGETVGVWLGRAVRNRIDGEGLRQVDTALGAVVQGAAALVVAWLVALPLTSSSAYPALTAAVRDSSVLRVVDGAMPATLRELPAELTRMLDVSGFPDVLAPFSTTPITPVGPVDQALLNSSVVRKAQPSVLKIRGRAPSCSRALEGSAFVVAPERLLTNAHVVAGTSKVTVESVKGELDAEVVSYDPATDAAVLAVPGLKAPVLPLAPELASTGMNALVLGYPLDGPYKPSPARIREKINLRGPDIYNSSTVIRDVYTVRAVVRSGNSGGPLIDESGRVLGMVFGAAVDDEETGFALTNEMIADDIAAAPRLTREVSTGPCAL